MIWIYHIASVLLVSANGSPRAVAVSALLLWRRAGIEFER